MDYNFEIKSKNSQNRSVLKTISWRIIATIITGLIVYAFTGEFGQTGKITLTAAAILTVAYYLHERFWIWVRSRK